jgi:glycerol-3-phosphate dehydrogenase
VLETQVLIIGGGATGTSIARDLALRGVSCVLVERDDINAGASGRNHGLLHSGARYVANDREAAAECCQEGALLKRLAPQCIQDTGGLFAAMQGDDERYVADFPGFCERAGIAVRALAVDEARALEPALSPRTIAVYRVPDASIDPFKLSLQSLAEARRLGTRLLRRTGVTAFEREGDRIAVTRVKNGLTGEETRIGADVVVNAAGAWTREVAALAGVDVPMVYSKGTLLVTHARVAHHVLNRLRKPSDADIVMPGGTVSIVGTTSITVPDLADVAPTIAEVDRIVDESSAMVPGLADMRYIRAYAGVRPLVSAGAGAGDGRAVSRGFALLDHGAAGVANLVTIAGGKLTTCRLMAERTADWVCGRLGVGAPCRTRTEPLSVAPEHEWTEPGLSARAWMHEHGSDAMLCECEMVSRRTLDDITDALGGHGERRLLADIALRSRLGKGACQGAFCTVRAAAHLVDRGILTGDSALRESAQFFGERWRGQQPILWGEQLAEAELAEALHCGLHGLELPR